MPAVEEYAVLMAFVSTLSERGTRMTVKPDCSKLVSNYTPLLFLYRTYAGFASDGEDVSEGSVCDPSVICGMGQCSK